MQERLREREIEREREIDRDREREVRERLIKGNSKEIKNVIKKRFNNVRH